MSTRIGTAGEHGWDCNHVVSSADAQAFAGHGYTFAIRYVRRAYLSANDLSVAEIQTLHSQGLAVMPVQHFGPSEGWHPTDDLGREYGAAAAQACTDLGLAPGVTVWLDLEGVAEGVDPEQIIRYCNYWWGKVAAAGFEPGIYVGWGNGLTPSQLYKRLRFTRYWASYNLNVDQEPAVCGVSMRQHAATGADKPAGIQYAIDTDTITGDNLGRFPTLFGP